MIHNPIHSSRRGGFTLVEMLVTAAVSILLMVIVTGAFSQGLGMFSKLRAQAKLQDGLRQMSTTLKDDLSWNHFQMPSSSGYGDDNAYLRGQDLTKADGGAWSPPPAGFFRIIELAEDPVNDPFLNPFAFDGSESFGYSFSRATKHALHFTVQRPANGPDQMLRTLDMQRAAGTAVFPRDFIDPTDYRENDVRAFVTRWTEVAYFLNPNGESAGMTPLYNLYRAHKLLLPLPQAPNPPPNSLNGGSGTVTVATNSVPVSNATPPEYNPEMSRRYIFPPNATTTIAVNQIPPPNPNTEAYNRPGDVTQPRNRFGMMPAYDQPDPALNTGSYFNLAGLFVQPLGRYPLMSDPAPNFGLGPNDLRANNDLLLTNVISFEVKAIWSFRSTATTYDPMSPPPVGFPNNYGYPTTYTIPDGSGGKTSIPNADYPFDFIPVSPVGAAPIPNPAGTTVTGNAVFGSQQIRVFDTWSSGGPYGATDLKAPTPGPYWQQTYPPANAIATAARLPLRIKIRALQIRIRVWDPKTEQTRQVTIVQDV